MRANLGRRRRPRGPRAPETAPTATLGKLRHLFAIGLAAGLFIPALAGCHPKPPVTYEPHLSLNALVPGLPAPENAFHVLVERRTQDRFPCTLAVAKFAYDPAATGDGEPPAPLRFVDMTPADEAYWAEALRGFAPVRDLRFLSGRSIVPTGGGAIGDLLAAARRVDAALLLIHAVNRYGPNSAQSFGVLYDVQTQQPLATLGTSACFPNEDGREQALDKKHKDLRDLDARYQASRALERLALGCLRGEVERDSPPTTPQPHRWTPLYPYCVPVPLAPGIRVPATQPAPRSGADYRLPPSPEPDRPSRPAEVSADAASADDATPEP
jgi:hypothetical protein